QLVVALLPQRGPGSPSPAGGAGPLVHLWFSVLRPLTMHRGSVMVPEASEKDAALYKEVHDFARARSILPFAISTLALVFLLVNLGASSSYRGMWKKVLIGAIVLAFFQFVIVPILI
ncbi:unnamed protein product, partial [Ascophyllum nodosum]